MSNLLVTDQILLHLTANNKAAIDRIEIFESISSTNDYLKAQNCDHDKIHICLAEEQTAGRGQFDRTWISPKAQNIYLSLLWYFAGELAQLSELSVKTAHAVKACLQKYGITESIHIKHPNDVLVRNKKICGCLIETQRENQNYIKVIIGIGLNVQMNSTDSELISQPWIDVAQLCDHQPDRNQLAGILIDEVINLLFVNYK
jgi:BirA family biotin operon repressor/biotin-[acetyl-CoA-carboxylase] ligase